MGADQIAVEQEVDIHSRRDYADVDLLRPHDLCYIYLHIKLHHEGYWDTTKSNHHVPTQEGDVADTHVKHMPSKLPSTRLHPIVVWVHILELL